MTRAKTPWSPPVLRRPTRRLLLFGAWALACACATPPPAPAKTAKSAETTHPTEPSASTVATPAPSPMLPMWQVRRADGSVAGFLLGSVHLLPQADSQLPPPIRAAYDGADTLVVEVDVTAVENSQVIGLRMAQLGTFPRNESLKDHVSETLYVEALREGTRLGLPEAGIRRMRPWLLSMTLSMSRMSRDGFSPELGVDVGLLNAAHGEATARPIISLETVDSQLRLFAGLSPEVQEALLSDTLTRLQTEDEMERMLALWKRGDSAGLAQLIFAPLRQDPSLQSFYDAFYFDRNRAMASRLAALFAEQRVHFVVVGAAHLVGPGSVVELLGELGLAVTQLPPSGIAADSETPQPAAPASVLSEAP